MGVTTLKTTPSHGMTANPLSTVARVNGGVFRMSSSWRRPQRRAIPNRCLSASRLVGPSSILRRREPPGKGDLPPPRAQENVRGKARPLSRASAEMGRSTDADGERERARASPADSLHRTLDKHCFIDAMATALGGHVRVVHGHAKPWPWHPPLTMPDAQIPGHTSMEPHDRRSLASPATSVGSTYSGGGAMPTC